ncbi:hypothetical protein SDC9_198848 [bioreactor metagenome]|uniref:Uncharacterized protein n=1 Tax=bioreactor metagenome TaxID=1076179 RepID=A0A645IJN9_9ZZZZ
MGCEAIAAIDSTSFHPAPATHCKANWGEVQPAARGQALMQRAGAAPRPPIAV